MQAQGPCKPFLRGMAAFRRLTTGTGQNPFGPLKAVEVQKSKRCTIRSEHSWLHVDRSVENRCIDPDITTAIYLK